MTSDFANSPGAFIMKWISGADKATNITVHAIGDQCHSFHIKYL
jgi:hypothetical protein